MSSSKIAHERFGAGGGTARLVVLCFICLLSCGVIGTLVRSPFPWIFLVLALTSGLSTVFVRSSTGRRLGLALTTVWLSFALAELLLFSVFATRAPDHQTDYGGMLASRPGLGPAPRPGSWSSASWVGMRSLYEVSYGIERHGWRTTGASHESASEAWLCFGGSFTFGQGLSDEESWPWLLQKELGGQAQVVNFGAPGWSAGQMLALAESSELMDPIEQRPRVAVYLAIPGHPRRVSGDEPFAVGFPRYQLSADGSLTRQGCYGDERQTGGTGRITSFVRRNLRRSALGRRLLGLRDRPATPVHAGQIELWAAVVERSEFLLQERFEGLRFVVIIWDSKPPEDPRWQHQEAMIGALLERDVEVVRASNWLPRLATDPAWIISEDLHPSAHASDVFARSLTEWWRGQERTR